MHYYLKAKKWPSFADTELFLLCNTIHGKGMTSSQLYDAIFQQSEDGTLSCLSMKGPCPIIFHVAWLGSPIDAYTPTILSDIIISWDKKKMCGDIREKMELKNNRESDNGRQEPRSMLGVVVAVVVSNKGQHWWNCQDKYCDRTAKNIIHYYHDDVRTVSRCNKRKAKRIFFVWFENSKPAMLSVWAGCCDK